MRSASLLVFVLWACLSQTAGGSPPPPAELSGEDLAAIEQILHRIIEDNQALARRVKADAVVLKAVQQAEFFLGDDSASATAKALQAIEETSGLIEAASPEAMTVLQQARVLVEDAERHPQSRRSIRERFHHTVTDRMVDVMRGNNITLFDRLLQLRNLQKGVDAAVEVLERATFEEFKANTPD